MNDELAGAQATMSPPLPRPRRDRPAPYEADTPPWVGALEGRLLAHLEPLKADVSDMNMRHNEIHRELVHFTTEMKAQEIRLDDHDAQLREHAELHEGSLLRISTLEKEVKELRAASRSPTPSHAPRSPRDRSPTPGRERNIEEELQLAIGGWQDCRRDDAVEEAKAMFEAAGLKDAWEDIYSSYNRTSHVRVVLAFPSHYKTVPQQRAFQTQVLEKLKARKWTSSVQGNENRVIWISRHRTPEDRAKIRAIVSVKEFIDQLTFGGGLRKQHGEIDWRGKMFVGNVNVLGGPDSAEPYQEQDLALMDARGNHSGWFIRAEPFQRATGLPGSQLQELWDQRVLEGSDTLLGTDHKCCTVALQQTFKSRTNRALAEQLDTAGLDLSANTLQDLATQACHRPKSLRYKDGKDIKALISLRRKQSGADARKTAHKIAVTRALAKKEWMTSLLDRGAAGDYFAISFFKRRQSARHSQGSFIMRAGGQEAATRDLKHFYKVKYTPPNPTSPDLTMQMYDQAVGETPNADPITPEEIQLVLDTTKAGKSAGADGVPYELIYSLMQSPLQAKFVSFYNSILQERSRSRNDG
ncbi:unnamed protein product [Symbiodinium sp. CCMP2456]|nr:unnamed protein product [Symbiodinium sp. CCMP2456]